MNWDVIVIGAGLAGITAAEVSASRGKEVLLIEKRSHIGGNSFDCYDDHNILIHLYGPHIFHTQYGDVWDYLSKFTQWRPYIHRVLAHIDGIDVPIPFNFNSMDMLFSKERSSRICEKLKRTFGFNSKVPILDMMEYDDEDIRFIARFVYDKVFLNYTVKQWGITPDEIDPGVTARVPVLIGSDNRYFYDQYQGVPLNGYTKMFERMLDKPNISIMLQTDYKKIIGRFKSEKIIYTGPIDYYFDYKFGKLAYRSLKFDFDTLSKENYQEAAVINFPNDHDFTRITEFKHLTGQVCPSTTILREIPMDYVDGKNEPCYPVHTKENSIRYSKYKEEADALNNVMFLGRLAEYKYYNMDQVVKTVRKKLGCE